MTTCQICEREIKAKRGYIAHHGYQRPGQGWQTGSCWGAQHRPYDVACDQLAIYVDSLASGVEKLRERIATPVTTLRLPVKHKPSEYTRRETFEEEQARMRDVTADNFVAIRAEFRAFASLNAYTWEACLARRLGQLQRQLEWAEADHARHAKRLADWKPAAVPEEKAAV